MEDNTMEFQTAKGVRDVPPEEKIVKNSIVNVMTEQFELAGFAPLETPILERYETLAAKFTAGEASDALKEIFKLKDQGDRLLALRFDLTVPLSRFVAMNPNLKMPFKQYEFGVVFRDGPIKLGRYRQFWQAELNIVGSQSMLAEAEILSVVQNVFTKLDLDIVIKVNNRKLLNGLLEQAGIKDKEEALISLDKLDKIGKDGVSQELKQRGYSQKQIDTFFDLIEEGISLADLAKKITSSEAKEGLQELEELFQYCKIQKIDAVFDVSLCRGLAYYTSTVFETRLKDGSFTASLAGGGRFDKMIGNFIGGGREIPAVGIAFGLEPIIDVISLKKRSTVRTPARVLVLPINTVEQSLSIVVELRQAAIPTDLALLKGVTKNLQYAAALGIPYVVIIGENELKLKKVLLRDMTSGVEEVLTLKEVIKKLQ